MDAPVFWVVNSPTFFSMVTPTLFFPYVAKTSTMGDNTKVNELIQNIGAGLGVRVPPNKTNSIRKIWEGEARRQLGISISDTVTTLPALLLTKTLLEGLQNNGATAFHIVGGARKGPLYPSAVACSITQTQGSTNITICDERNKLWARRECETCGIGHLTDVYITKQVPLMMPAPVMITYRPRSNTHEVQRGSSSNKTAASSSPPQ